MRLRSAQGPKKEEVLLRQPTSEFLYSHTAGRAEIQRLKEIQAALSHFCLRDIALRSAEHDGKLLLGKPGIDSDLPKQISKALVSGRIVH